MKRLQTFVLVVTIISLGLAGCKSKQDHPTNKNKSGEQQKADHPTDHPK